MSPFRPALYAMLFRHKRLHILKKYRAISRIAVKSLSSGTAIVMITASEMRCSPFYGKPLRRSPIHHLLPYGFHPNGHPPSADSGPCLPEPPWFFFLPLIHLLGQIYVHVLFRCKVQGHGSIHHVGTVGKRLFFQYKACRIKFGEDVIVCHQFFNRAPLNCSK